MVYRVVMRDRCGRVTAMSGEITGSNEDCQRLAKRTFLEFQAPNGEPHYSCHVLAGDREVAIYSRRHLMMETC
jgi:hypothetical protein